MCFLLCFELLTGMSAVGFWLCTVGKLTRRASRAVFLSPRTKGWQKDLVIPNVQCFFISQYADTNPLKCSLTLNGLNGLKWPTEEPFRLKKLVQNWSFSNGHNHVVLSHVGEATFFFLCLFTTACPHWHYGPACKNVCQCAFGAQCNSLDGSCLCPPGLTGEICATGRKLICLLELSAREALR